RGPSLCSSHRERTRLLLSNLIALREGDQRTFEDLHRRPHQAGAHLADTRMPVLTRGVMPSSTTLRRSIPTGVPRKPRVGMVNWPCSATVISYISSVALTASWGVPPMKVTIAGAAAMAKAPMPAVSVIVLSPMSGLASALEKPGK